MNVEELEYQVPTLDIPYNRIFMISDLHFGVRANSLEWLENQLDFFYNFYIPYLEENRREGDVLFMLGDWFDNRQLLDINVLNKAMDLILDMAEMLPLYLMTGNHDIYKKHDTDVNSLAAFKYIPNVTILEDPVVVRSEKSKILVLPWIGNGEKEEAFARANKADYIFAHTDIAGFKYDNGFNIKRGAKLKGLPGVKKVYSGHIHKRQEHKDSVYIGSPYSTKRSDIGNKKGVYMLDPHNHQQEFTPNPLSPVFQRIPLETLMELTLEKAYDLLEHNYTDIIVPDKYVRLFNLTRFIDLLKDCKYKRIETRGEKDKLDDSFNEILDGEEIKDIITLLENSIDDLEYTMEMMVKLKLLNREYYEKASKEQEELA